MSPRRPLARVHAVTDGAVLALADLAIRAAGLAAGGSAVALHARYRGGPVGALVAAASRFIALSRPAEASVFVSGRPDVAAALGAQGVQLSAADIAPADARTLLTRGWIGRSVHDASEAARARDEGADFVMAGPVYDTASHPDRAGAGPGLVAECVAAGLPVIAIGGITAERIVEVRDAGAYGVAAIRGLWLSADPARAALTYLQCFQ
jgi:thiamine-phosphate diphosphorylase